MGGSIVALAAARRRRQRLKLEEEMMTPYTPQDLEGWEFKIIRGPFRDPEFLEAVLAEEDLSGWELVEKFDDSRLRLKRLASHRQRDPNLQAGIDPYRTQYGLAENQTALVIIGVTSTIFLAAGLLAFLFFENTVSWLVVVPIIALILGVVGVVVTRLRGAVG